MPISPFLVVNQDEVLFDYLVGSKIKRVRIPRILIDTQQGRRLAAGEASSLVRARMADIGQAIFTGQPALERVLAAPFLPARPR